MSLAGHFHEVCSYFRKQIISLILMIHEKFQMTLVLQKIQEKDIYLKSQNIIALPGSNV